MSETQLREEVNALMKDADERLLRMVYAMAKAYTNEIVAHATDGTPLTREDYEERLQKAEEEIEAGRYYTTEELREKVKGWEKKYRK